MCFCITRLRSLKPWTPILSNFCCRLPSENQVTGAYSGPGHVLSNTLYLKLMSCAWNLQSCSSGGKTREDLASQSPSSIKWVGDSRTTTIQRKNQRLREGLRKILQEGIRIFNVQYFWLSPGRFYSPTQHHSCWDPSLHSFSLPSAGRLHMGESATPSCWSVTITDLGGEGLRVRTSIHPLCVS